METKADNLMIDILCDPDLKREFISNPKRVLKEKGLEVEDNIEYRVVEDTKDIRYIIIPYVEEGISSKNEPLEKRSSKFF